MAHVDVTEQFQFGNSDDELLPVTKCACGAKFPMWNHNLSVYEDDPRDCEHCGRKFYFTQRIQIFEVVD